VGRGPTIWPRHHLPLLLLLLLLQLQLHLLLQLELLHLVLVHQQLLLLLLLEGQLVLLGCDPQVARHRVHGPTAKP
jgi:hypothetical protein